MSANKLLTWRARGHNGAAVSDPELIWTMHKSRWQIDCALQNCGRTGWSVQMRLDGQPFLRCQFTSWEDAVESAEDQYAELARGGWTPIPLRDE